MTYDPATTTERYVYVASNQPIDNRWKVWGSCKVNGVPEEFTEEVYNTQRQAIAAMGAYARDCMGWKRGSYFKSICEYCG